MNAIDLREEAGERDRGLKSIEAAAIEITDRIAEGVEGRRGLLLTAGSAGDESPAPKASGLRGSRLVSDRREGTDRPGQQASCRGSEYAATEENRGLHESRRPSDRGDHLDVLGRALTLGAALESIRGWS